MNLSIHRVQVTLTWNADILSLAENNKMLLLTDFSKIKFKGRKEKKIYFDPSSLSKWPKWGKVLIRMTTILVSVKLVCMNWNWTVWLIPFITFHIFSVSFSTQHYVCSASMLLFTTETYSTVTDIPTTHTLTCSHTRQTDKHTVLV